MASNTNQLFIDNNLSTYANQWSKAVDRHMEWPQIGVVGPPPAIQPNKINLKTFHEDDYLILIYCNQKIFERNLLQQKLDKQWCAPQVSHCERRWNTSAHVNWTR